RRRHTRFSRDWSSDVCSSDLCFDAADTPAKNQLWEKIEIDLGIINTLSDREIRDKIERQLAKLLDRRNMNLLDVGGAESKPGVKIGRASCRERVEIAVGRE